jgi:hypothetical protein
LHRTKLSRQLALDHIHCGQTALSKYNALIDCSVSDHTPDVQTAVTSVITKTHFLLLKVNFEYYLNRLVYCVWDRYFTQLVHQQKNRLLSKEYQLREFARAVAEERAKEYVTNKVIPRHGLMLLRDALEKSTGIALEKVLNGRQPWYWCQIHSAFEVRHLIEHTNGRTDSEFMADVYTGPLWRASSWGDLALSVGCKIEIRDGDFEKTWQAMVESVPILCEAAMRFQPAVSARKARVASSGDK